jgi:hypothetical protein
MADHRLEVAARADVLVISQPSWNSGASAVLPCAQTETFYRPARFTLNVGEINHHVKSPNGVK